MATFRKPKRGSVTVVTPHLHVAGIGLRLGHNRHDVGLMVCEVLKRSTEPALALLLSADQVHMAAGASYVFIDVGSAEVASRVRDALDGQEVFDGAGTALDQGKRRVLRATFAEFRPAASSAHDGMACTLDFSDAPEGLTLIPDFLGVAEEAALLRTVEAMAWDTTLARRTQHFGFTFNYGLRAVDFGAKTPALPAEFAELAGRIVVAAGLPPELTPNQVTVNEYLPGQVRVCMVQYCTRIYTRGLCTLDYRAYSPVRTVCPSQGISSHVDTHGAFDDALVSISLGAGVVMDFKHIPLRPPGLRASTVALRRTDLLPGAHPARVPPRDPARAPSPEATGTISGTVTGTALSAPPLPASPTCTKSTADAGPQSKGEVEGEGRGGGEGRKRSAGTALRGEFGGEGNGEGRAPHGASEAETARLRGDPSPPARYLQWLPPRSALVLRGASRYAWAHGIAPRRADKVRGAVVPRAATRVSLTFRRVLMPGSACRCGCGETPGAPGEAPWGRE